MAKTSQIQPMPFPGESPTVSLALAAGRMYAPKPEDEKPKRAAPKRRKAATKKPSRATAKSKASKARSRSR